MGAYLSEPVTEKHSKDLSNDLLTCASSSMQGWRVSQEDAHNLLLDFDKETSLFAVYDGHGGPEVALYCADKLPDFIRSTDAYKKGDMQQALKDAFLGFDASISEEHVIELLKNLSSSKNASDKEEMSSEEDVASLCQEAKMPLDKLLAKYKPNLKVKTDHSSANESTSSTEKLSRNNGESSGCSKSDGYAFAGSDKDDALVSSSTSLTNNKSKLDLLSANGHSSLKDEHPDPVHVPDVASSEEPCTSGKIRKSEYGENDASSTECKEAIANESRVATSSESRVGTSTDSRVATSTDTDSSVATSTDSKEATSTESNGTSSRECNVETCSSSNPESGETSEDPKIKEIDSIKGKRIKNLGSSKAKTQRMIRSYAQRLLLATDSDSGDSDDHDETFSENSSSNETEDGSEEGSDSCDEGDPEDEEFMASMREEPGSDSGCTAVVAIVRDGTLYVANAGDSRCILCRDGQAIDMSVDHKPEDAAERERIVNAGGRVTNDGRVNGGLNLSRAIGDHAYKQNKDLPPEKQMISAMPDVRQITLTPQDEFLVLACDGVWNYLTSQETVEFIRSRLNSNEKLSNIIEMMFDHCLAPNTMGDGTGCDNMTAVVVCFKKSTDLKLEDDTLVNHQLNNKRPLSPELDTNNQKEYSSNKKMKSGNEEYSDVDSSESNNLLEQVQSK